MYFYYEILYNELGDNMFKRQDTLAVKVGDLIIGGSDQVIIQSMTTTKTKNVEETVSQIKALATAGCQIVRVAVFDMADAKALLESIARSFGYIYGRDKNVRINTISQSPNDTISLSPR